jgi:hypothetical protein
MVLGKSVDEGLEKLDPFQFGDRIESGLFEKRQVFLNDIVTERVKGMDVDLIGIRANKGKQPAAHGDGSGIGICEAEDVLGENVRIQEYLPDPGCEDLGLARTGAGYYHDRSLRGVHGKALLFI